MSVDQGAEPEPVLRLSGITKRFGSLVANDAVSIDLGRGEIIALLGENGAGKTTLMNILFGHYLADEGTIEAFGERLPAGDPNAALAAGIGMVHQHFTLADQMSVVENIALGTQSLFSLHFNRASAAARISTLASDFGLDVDPNAMIADLSVGERQRVEILKALYRDARILILDEPTAVLTPQETEALFKTLKTLVTNGLSIIFISHKLHEVLAVSDRVLVLRGGKLAGERKTAETDRAELAALMVGEAISEPEFIEHNPGAPVAEFSGVSTRGRHGGAPLEAIDLVLHEGEVTGLAGIAGNGQAALAALLAGTLSPVTGTMRIYGKTISDWSARSALDHGIGRIPEDRHATGMIGDMSVTENVISETYRSSRFSRFGFLDWIAAEQFARSIIDDYSVKCPSPDSRVRLLSGGNIQKLILGRAFDGDPRIILANQPTRGLDIGAVAYVHGKLLEARGRGAAILLISEDLDEVLALSDRICVISKGRLSEPHPRGSLTTKQIGAMMAGQGFEEAQRSSAA